MNTNQARKLQELAESRDYGRGIKHAEQVKTLCLRTYDELCRLKLVVNSEKNRALLASSSLLHDLGLPGSPHNEAGFDLLAVEIPRVLASDPLKPEELSTILYCVLWHRDSNFSQRGSVAIADSPYTEKMAAILRVADALDRSLHQVVGDVSLILRGRHLTFHISSRTPAEIEIHRAGQKANLMKEAFALEVIDFEGTKASGKKRILLVCGGNTCRSPMSKVILEQKLKAIGKLGGFEIDSAACGSPTYQTASKEAREAIKTLFGEDLLATHQAKKVAPNLIQWADLILVMTGQMKGLLPAGKTYTLKEFAGGSGDIIDPFGGSQDTYIMSAKEISAAVDKIIPRLLAD